MNKFKTTTDTIYNENAKKDIVIAHIADLHFSSNTSPKMLAKLSDYIIKMNADYLMITGDLIDIPKITTDKEKIKELLDFLTGIAKKMKVMISIGNHDVLTNESFRFFEKLDDLYNIYVLNNKSYQDEFIYVAGFTFTNDYYYNITSSESADILIENLSQNKKLITNLPTNLPKVALIHSPIRLTDDNVINKLSSYDLILCGHMHNGLVPKWLYPIFRGNIGFVGPNGKLFPSNAKGKIEKKINGKTITIIINGAITTFSKQAGILFSKLDFIYNKSINKVIIQKKRGIKYEN